MKTTNNKLKLILLYYKEFLIRIVPYNSVFLSIARISFLFVSYFFAKIFKLDGVGPVDNRPSPAKLHHFVRKKKEKKSDK